MQQSGIGVDGSVFNFDGVVYLNLKLLLVNGGEYVIEYEPVLVSSKVSTNIFGIKTEERFKYFTRDIKNETISYGIESKPNIVLKCYRENLNHTSAYVQVLKSII